MWSEDKNVHKRKKGDAERTLWEKPAVYENND